MVACAYGRRGKSFVVPEGRLQPSGHRQDDFAVGRRPSADEVLDVLFELRGGSIVDCVQRRQHGRA